MDSVSPFPRRCLLDVLANGFSRHVRESLPAWVVKDHLDCPPTRALVQAEARHYIRGWLAHDQSLRNALRRHLGPPTKSDNWWRELACWQVLVEFSAIAPPDLGIEFEDAPKLASFSLTLAEGALAELRGG